MIHITKGCCVHEAIARLLHNIVITGCPCVDNVIPEEYLPQVNVKIITVLMHVVGVSPFRTLRYIQGRNETNPDTRYTGMYVYKTRIHYFPFLPV